MPAMKAAMKAMKALPVPKHFLALVKKFAKQDAKKKAKREKQKERDAKRKSAA